MQLPETQPIDCSSFDYLGDKFNKKFAILQNYDDQIYIYRNNYWVRTTKNHLINLARLVDDPRKTTKYRCRETVANALIKKYVENFKWNQNLESFEIPILDGILNINTNIITSHSSENYVNFNINCSFNNDSKFSLWEAYINELFKNEENKKLLLQEYFGYILSTNIDISKSLLILDLKNNSEFLRIFNILNKFLYENYYVSEMEKLKRLYCMMGKGFEMIENIINKRVHIVIGQNQKQFPEILGAILNEFNLHYKHEQYIKNIIFMTNKPKISNSENNRMLILELNQQVKLEEFKNFDQYNLTKEDCEGLLNWSIDGLKRLIKNDSFTKI